MLTITAVFDLSYYYADMELHSVGLRPGANTQGYSTASSTLSDQRHLCAPSSCLESARKFLDTLLACPLTEYGLISFVEWMRLPRVIMTICKLSLPSNAHVSHWDVKAVQDRVRLDLYLESLCYRMQKLTTYRPPDQTIPDFWVAMEKIMESIRTWYVRKMQPSPLTPIDLSRSSQMPSFNSSNFQPRHYATPASFFDPDTADNASTGNVNGAGQVPTSQATMDASASGMSTPAPDDFFGMSFDLDQFMDMEFWGGAGSYDPTIYDSGDMGY